MSDRTPNGILPGQVTQLTTTLLPEPPYNVTPTAHGQTITQGAPIITSGPEFVQPTEREIRNGFLDDPIGPNVTQGEPSAWSTEPPREPGWYWSELASDDRPPIWSRAPRKIIEDDGVLYQINGGNDPRDVREMATRGWSWYSVPISEPPR